MRPALLVCALVAALVPVVASAQSAVRAAAPVLSEASVEGTLIHRVQAETVIHAPFEAVSARLLDYGRYPEFLRRFRSARVVRRNRAQTDVYFQIELPRAMGVVWFVHEMTVVDRSANHLEIHGVARSGNAGRVETLVVLERIAGTPGSTRFTFSLFGVPVVPALPDAINDALRGAVRAAVVLLRERSEHPTVDVRL